MVLIDITPEQARQTLERFREKIAGYNFPNVERVTVSIGHTRFDKSLSIDELIGQANAALDYCKKTTRNAVKGKPISKYRKRLVLRFPRRRD
jgi:GGDEF domain-containing protein